MQGDLCWFWSASTLIGDFRPQEISVADPRDQPHEAIFDSRDPAIWDAGFIYRAQIEPLGDDLAQVSLDSFAIQANISGKQ